jgi:hypothetical protein
MSDYAGNRFAYGTTLYPTEGGGYVKRSRTDHQERWFRGDISMSADGDYMHVYTRGLDVFIESPTDGVENYEKYYISSYYWKPS